MSKNTKTIEETYQYRKNHEQVLKAPDMFIGNVEETTQPMWIWNNDTIEGDRKIILKEISYVPGFYKICDEIYVNARDHCIRCKTCNVIKISVDQTSGLISVWNNGVGIPVVKHKTYGTLVPTFIFSKLKSSSNYDENEKKITGGKNGYGAKLTNIYSKEFTVETIDSERQLRFVQKFADNMYTVGEPKITKAPGKKAFTKISFIPDFERFGLTGITDDMFALLKKRAYDIAMCTNAKVYFNDELISENNFSKYVDLYFPGKIIMDETAVTEDEEIAAANELTHKKVLDVTNKRWKVCVVFDPTGSMEHQTISFVNGICTYKGGTHVDHILNPIINKLKALLAKKTKTVIKPSIIKEYIVLFVDAVIENPRFEAQTKECLGTKADTFGSKYDVKDTFINKVLRTGLSAKILEKVEKNSQLALGKLGKNKGGAKYINKLSEASAAGTKEGYKCRLILTEGDSANTLVMAGFNLIGRKYYGSFPLKGKLLNVREKTKKIATNKEINNIMAILGLQAGKVYKDVKQLRYGGIIILTDQDADGSHIKGLIINFIHYFWPDLLKNTDFVQCLTTPIVIASKGKQKNLIYSMSEYNKWKEDHEKEKGWKIQYYKGLGTHDSLSGKNCFSDLDDKLIHYTWPKITYQEVKRDDWSEEISRIMRPINQDLNEDAIRLAFEKERAGIRKHWLNTFEPAYCQDNEQKEVSIYDFIHRELIAFSVYSNIRAIPNVMDGLKNGQRKIICAAFKSKLFGSVMKVAQFAGYVSLHMSYHHGEKSLCDTIINMAQNFVGSNNLNLFFPSGGFGSRIAGGKDHAAERYIFTKLYDINKIIFNKYDYPILTHQTEENTEIEPVYYAPVVPMLLINGSSGIGTGWSSTIHPCNPKDVVDNLRKYLNGEKTVAMKPWYRNFTGTVERIDKERFLIKAKYTIAGDVLTIHDLPIGTWTTAYKKFLNNIITGTAPTKSKDPAKVKKTTTSGGKKAKANNVNVDKKINAVRSSKKNDGLLKECIKTYTEECTDVIINIKITFNAGKLDFLVKKGLLDSLLKLVKPIKLTNMCAFDPNGKIKRYKTYTGILKDYADTRLDLYQKRKDYLLGKWRNDMDILEWKLKYILDVINQKIIIFTKGKSKKKAEIIAKLEEMKFPMFKAGAEVNPSYNYLTSLTIFHLTEDEVEKLKKEIEEKKKQIEELESKEPKDIWLEELDQFWEEYVKWDQEAAEVLHELTKKDGTKKNVTKKDGTKKNAPKKVLRKKK